jgi:AcrR family transcriptional regulator
MTEVQLGRRTRQTRESIFTAAMSLFSKKGVANVSMQDIADKAQTARSTVFKHYPQKFDLLADFFMRFASSSLENAKSRHPSDLKSGMSAFFRAMQEEALKVEPVLREVAGLTGESGPLAEDEAVIDNQMIVYISTYLSLGIKNGEIHPNTDINEAAGLILCVITETNHRAIRHNRVQYLASDHQSRFDILFRGLHA